MPSWLDKLTDAALNVATLGEHKHPGGLREYGLGTAQSFDPRTPEGLISLATLLVPGGGKGKATGPQGDFLRAIRESTFQGHPGIWRKPMTNSAPRRSDKRLQTGGVSYPAIDPTNTGVQALMYHLGSPFPPVRTNPRTGEVEEVTGAMPDFSPAGDPLAWMLAKTNVGLGKEIGQANLKNITAERKVAHAQEEASTQVLPFAARVKQLANGSTVTTPQGVTVVRVSDHAWRVIEPPRGGFSGGSMIFHDPLAAARNAHGISSNLRSQGWTDRGHPQPYLEYQSEAAHRAEAKAARQQVFPNPVLEQLVQLAIKMTNPN